MIYIMYLSVKISEIKTKKISIAYQNNLFKLLKYELECAYH